MVFTVSRSSDLLNRNAPDAPCAKAVFRKIIKIETRNFHTFEEYENRMLESWLSVGTNHKINEDGFIQRDNGFVSVWTIEINSLEELIAFYQKYGDIIIRKCRDNPNYLEFEIYDYYRE